jgi:hypothetical protein
MKVWACGRHGEFVSLDTLARFFKIGGKPDGVNGGDFARLFHAPETREQAITYLHNDLTMTAKLAQRMGIFAGQIAEI